VSSHKEYTTFLQSFHCVSGGIGMLAEYWIRQVWNLRSSARIARSAFLQRLQGFSLVVKEKQMLKVLSRKLGHTSIISTGFSVNDFATLCNLLVTDSQ
jgi:hypothetical protein